VPSSKAEEPSSGTEMPSSRVEYAGSGAGAALRVDGTSRVMARVYGAVAASVCLTPLVVATRIAPDPAGHGTHEALGLPACGWAATTGAPCPTCGMTTAFAHAVRGEVVASFLAQPMGFLLALGAAVGFWGGLHVALTGSRLGTIAARLLTPRVLWCLAGIGAVSWAYKWVTWVG
jgi:hypothetical protein